MTSILDSNVGAVVDTGAVVVDDAGTDVDVVDVVEVDVLPIGACDSASSDAHAPRMRHTETTRSATTRDRGPSVTPSS